MLASNGDVELYLQHRMGKEIDQSTLSQIELRSLGDNDNFAPIASTFGNRTISGYVGFIDLKGYSEQTSGMSPEQICRFISPFLEAVISNMTPHRFLIDKTIGDEIMFVALDTNDRFSPGILQFGQFLGAMRTLSEEHNPPWKFRIGISYGEVYIARIEAGSYREWAVFGECIAVAKRLMDLPALQDPNPVLCAFGMKQSDVGGRLSHFCAYNTKWRNIRETSESLDGVKQVSYVIIEPADEEVELSFDDAE